MRQLIENGRLVLRLVQDPRVPVWIKAGIPLLVALYFVSPIDFIPDVFLGPGQLDDLGIVLLGMTLLIRLAPKDVVEEHQRALGLDTGTFGPTGTAGSHNGPPETPRERGTGGTIEGEYRVVPPERSDNGTTRKL